MVHRSSLLIVLIISFLFSHAQYRAYCIVDQGEKQCFFYTDSLSMQKNLQNEVSLLRKQSYLSAGVDSQMVMNDSLFIYLGRGNAFNTLEIRNHNFGLETGDLQERKHWPYQEFTLRSERLITYMENNGFPFAFLRLDSVDVKGDTISVSAYFDKGQLTKYDTIAIRGSSKLSKKYLYKYLNIEPGAAYDESIVKLIDKRLRNLPQVKVNGPTRVYFFYGLARIVVDIDDRVTDRFDGIVGVAPNSDNVEDNSLLLTGEVTVELNNLFGSAKQLGLHWRNYLKRSQLLDVETTLPYLFNTRIGVNAAFNLNKYDTIFVNLNSKLGFRYQQSGNNYFQVYYQFTGSNLLTADTNFVRNQKRIPNNNPFRVDNYGIALFQSDLDYLPNPRRGYRVSLDMAIGVKTLLRNIQIDLVQFPNPDGPGTISIYDTLDKSSLRGRFDLQTTFYIPLFKQSTLVNRLNVAGVIADQILFNELYNFGGFSSLRGFDENSIFASKYLYYNLEYRYLLSQNSNVGLFFNMAAIENTIESDKLLYDIPYGFGAVANIEVRNGILSMAYALGSQQGNGIQFRSAKFHFGIVNYF